MKDIFLKHYKLYLMEALGLGIFMVSACFFTAMMEHHTSTWHIAFPNNHTRLIIIAAAMGLTALFIFYSPVTAPSGAHINPAITLVQLRLGNINKVDAFFYILFQLIGGTLAVYAMAFLLGNTLTASPVNYVVTVPGKNVPLVKAAFCEIFISFIMVTMILNTSVHDKLKKYTRLFAAILVAGNVILAGPVSGFGMNPARSFASAFPAHTWTAFWIYIICPLAGMFGACEIFIAVKNRTL
jgi:aquaporin Z